MAALFLYGCSGAGSAGPSGSSGAPGGGRGGRGGRGGGDVPVTVALASRRDVRIVLTTDHGSIRCMHGSKVIGDREASTNLRYKFGRNLKSDLKEAIFLKDPHDFKLPRSGVTTNYIIAKEDYYFVYPTDYHKYLSQYRDSFQHGGISMEEVILPVIMMEPK